MYKEQNLRLKEKAAKQKELERKKKQVAAEKVLFIAPVIVDLL